MITYNDKTYRNLQEQVLKNQADIQDFVNTTEILGKFGIAIVGSVLTAAELPDPATFPGDYGDAYTVGLTYPYNYYVFTRPNTALGETEDRWLDIGAFPLPGPTGATGATGPAGPRGESTQWFYSISREEPRADEGNEGDYFLNYGGRVYYREANGWTNTGISLAGPQGPIGDTGSTGPIGPIGPIGPQGEKGDPAGVVVIRAIVASVDDLPSPSTLNNQSYAYLVGTAAPYRIFVQVGTSPATAIWTNVGNITDEGNYVQKQNITDSVRLYRANNNNPLMTADTAATPNTMPIRDEHGCLFGKCVETDGDDVLTNKAYVDNAIANVPSGGGSTATGFGQISAITLMEAAAAMELPFPTDCDTDFYVDATISADSTATTHIIQIAMKDENDTNIGIPVLVVGDGNQTTLRYKFARVSPTIHYLEWYSQGGQLRTYSTVATYVGSPTKISLTSTPGTVPRYSSMSITGGTNV